jgi:hypothetical protein
LEQAIDVLLRHQYVSSTVTGSTHAVVIGSGMGQKHSTSIASSSFMNRGDKRITAKGTVAAFGILYYCRYVDDLLVIADGGSVNMCFFYRWLCHRLSPVFELELVECSNTSVAMLDLRITKVGTGLAWEPLRSQSAAPLCTTSCHPGHVHSSWPVAMLRYTFRICSDLQRFHVHSAALIRRFENWNSPPWLICKLSRIRDELLLAGPDRRSFRASTSDAIPTLWLSLSWHTMWGEVQLSRVLRDFADDGIRCSDFGFAFGHTCALRIAWRRSLPQFVHYVQKLTYKN